MSFPLTTTQSKSNLSKVSVSHNSHAAQPQTTESPCYKTRHSQDQHQEKCPRGASRPRPS